MAHSEDVYERWEAVEQLRLNFENLPDKVQAWNELLLLLEDEDQIVQLWASELLVSAFLHVPDKDQAWNDLLLLTKDNDDYVRWCADEALGSIFPNVMDKEQATKNLLEFTKDENGYVQVNVVFALVSAFPYITDKEVATKNLLEFTKDKDSDVRSGVAFALGFAFPYITDKGAVWDALLALTKDDYNYVRRGVASAFGFVYPHVTDKWTAWNALLALTKDDDNYVRMHAAFAIGSAFPHITDKVQAWNELLVLIEDEMKNVRSYANHSLGRISILKATEAEREEAFRKELEHALGYFESSAKESSNLNNLAEFCLPFYRSFHAITFRKEESKDEVKSYIEQAREAVEGSESKEKLLEAIENLSNALTEAQKARTIGEMQTDLTAYSRYCNRAADLLGETEKDAPGATGLIRKGLPIINQQIKDILEEIQERSTALRKQTIDTPLENFGKNVNQEAFDLSQVRDPIALEKHINSMLIALSPVCEKMSEIDPESCRLHKLATQETFVEDKLPLINMILAKMPAHIEIGQIGQKLDELLLSIKPGISEELVISVGSKLLGTGFEHVVHIPLQEISYPELKEDLEKIKGETKLASYPTKLASKVKEYLIRNKKDDLLNKLS